MDVVAQVADDCAKLDGKYLYPPEVAAVLAFAARAALAVCTQDPSLPRADETPVREVAVPDAICRHVDGAHHRRQPQLSRRR